MTRPGKRMNKARSPRPFFEGLSAKAKAKLERDFEAAKADPLAQQMVDNLNKASAKNASEQRDPVKK